MPGGRKNPNLIDQLALHVASGGKVASWAKTHKVAVRTAYGWTADPEFKRQVAGHRRTLNDRAVGQLTRHSTRAIRKIARLMDSAASEVVQLNAAKTILTELVVLADRHDIEMRLAALEEKARDR